MFQINRRPPKHVGGNMVISFANGTLHAEMRPQLAFIFLEGENEFPNYVTEKEANGNPIMWTYNNISSSVSLDKEVHPNLEIFF